MKTVLLVTISALLISTTTACSSQTAEPTESASVSVSTTADPEVSEAEAREELRTILEKSIARMTKSGVVGTYSTAGIENLIEVYDPNTSFDYKGVALIIKTNKTELFLDLNMFALYTLSEPLTQNQVAAVAKNLDGSFTAVVTQGNQERTFIVSVDDDGLISKMTLLSAESQSESQVDLQYSIDADAAALIKRGNEDFIATSP